MEGGADASNNNSSSKQATNFNAAATILRSRGMQGFIGAGIIFGIMSIIISLSKFNEMRQMRLPMLWRRRLRSLVVDAAKEVRLSEDSNDAQIAYHHAVRADALLKGARDMVGQSSLNRMTGYNIEKLEADIERGMGGKSINNNNSDDNSEPITFERRNPEEMLVTSHTPKKPHINPPVVKKQQQQRKPRPQGPKEFYPQ